MRRPEYPIYFVQISDSHIGPTADYQRHGHFALPCAQKAVEVINRLPVKPDFVIHTGDIVTNPDDGAYALAADVFAGLEVPIYYVVGNHDDARDVKRFLPMGAREDFGGDEGRLAYQFWCKGVRFLVLDALLPAEMDPQGRLPDEQLAAVREIVAAGDEPLVVFVHYPTLAMNAPWMDANMLLQNGDALHQALLPARERVRGVFSGHVHQNMQTVRDGIVYTSGASLFAQFTAWPTDVYVGFDAEHPPGFNFVHLLVEKTIVHQVLFRRP